MKSALISSLFLFFLVSCFNTNDYDSFKEIQRQNISQFTLDKSLFNIKGKVKSLILPFKTNNQQKIDLHFFKQNESGSSPNIKLVNEIIVNYKLVDFEYFEFDVTGNITKIITNPTDDGKVEEYYYNNDLLCEVRESSLIGEVNKIISFNYNKFDLLSQIKILDHIGSKLEDTSITKFSYTKNFIKYITISPLSDGRKDTIITILDKQNNRIEKSPTIIYKYNKDSLVTNIDYIKSKDKTSYFYDSFGNKVREVHYDSLKRPYIIKSYYYNFKNQLIESLDQDSSSYSIKRFNERNYLKDFHSVSFNERNLTYLSEWGNYDGFGNIIHSSVITMNESRNLKERLFKYSYEFDKHNNWIKKKIYKNDSFINEINRFIDYYK